MEFLMIEAPFVTEWKNEGILEGRKEGILEGRKEGILEGRKEGTVNAQVNTLLRLLQKRGTVPADLEQKIRECTDLGKLSAWLDLVFDLPSIEEFRQQSGL
jgi:predicted transposase YdaD